MRLIASTTITTIIRAVKILNRIVRVIYGIMQLVATVSAIKQPGKHIYTDSYFPEHNVRFIAINGGVDSEVGEDDFTPFRNIMNEWYAKDISRKIRSSQKLRGNSGEPLAPPPYGYRCDSENPKQWLIDDEAAEVVRKIYRLCIEGNGVETIARLLQEAHILTPISYWNSKGINKGGKKILLNHANGQKQQ